MKSNTTNRNLAALSVLAAAMVMPAGNSLAADPPYAAVVKGDGALAYYRFNDSTIRNGVNVNSGSLGAAGNATNDLVSFGGKVHPMSGAIVGDGNRASYFDISTRTEIPFNTALNTPNTQPFSVEAWLYPVNDQDRTGYGGMGALCNRFVHVGGSDFREGWVMYERRPNGSYADPGEGVGWEVRMYNGLDNSGHLDVISQVPFQLGKWQHVVFVYNPVGGDPLNATLTIYIDGAFANAVTNVSGAPGYGPCTGAHDADNAPNGQPAMALGGYNNSNPGGNYGDANPWLGGVDEFAWYSTALSAAQVLAHYQNGTNAARSISYDKLIKSDNPVAYLRLDEIAPGADILANYGAARATSNGTNSGAMKHPGSSALAGRSEDGSVSGHLRGADASGHAFISTPWNLDNNPDASVPFTIEGWFRPTSDDVHNGPALLNNRLANGIPNRTGWVFYQRDPSADYFGTPAAGGEGIGWDLRMYAGTGGASSDVKTQLPYKMNQWTHLVITWAPDPSGDQGMTPSGSEAWSGAMTAYVDGVAVATNPTAIYAANIQVPADVPSRAPADLAVGSYNLASALGEEFEGDIDEVAFYNNYILTDAQILDHYQTGTNAHPATNYETLVLTAAFVDTEIVGIPRTYYRFAQPGYFPAANSGSLGYRADGSLVLAQNNAAGPVTSGFEGSNTATTLNGTNNWVSMNNPAGLNISGQITLEAWIKPAANQTSDPARVISHGPATLSKDLGLGPENAVTNTTQVFLDIQGPGSGPFTYVVGSATYVDLVGYTYNTATFPAPAGDFNGSTWVHLAGTYDGSKWILYRNGAQVASTTSAVGALQVNDGEWAIGSTGMGWADFYTGSVDEVAIYGTALSPATIAAHYYVGQNGPVTLTATRSGANVLIQWPAGTLQQATSVNGPYTDVVGASAPSYSASGGTQKYFRVKL